MFYSPSVQIVHLKGILYPSSFSRMTMMSDSHCWWLGFLMCRNSAPTPLHTATATPITHHAEARVKSHSRHHGVTFAHHTNRRRNFCGKICGVWVVGHVTSIIHFTLSEHRHNEMHWKWISPRSIHSAYFIGFILWFSGHMTTKLQCRYSNWTTFNVNQDD